MKSLLVFFCLLTQTAFSQTDRIDSLKQVLRRLTAQQEGKTKDLLHFRIIKEIMRTYADLNLDSAFRYNTLLLQLSTASDMPEGIIYAIDYKGVLAQMKGNHAQSVIFHSKALAMATEQNRYLQMASAYAGVAQAYSSLNQDTLALDFCEKGLVLLRSHSTLNSYQEQLALLNVQGWVYSKLGRFTESIRASQKMYRLARTKPGDQWYEVHGLHAIGIAYKELGDISKAVEYHEKALTLSRSINLSSVELEGNILVNLADIYIRQKSWQRALEYSSKGKQIAIEVKNSKIVAEADGQLYVIYKHLKKTEQALKAYEDFVMLKDSLSKVENQQLIDLLRAQNDNILKTTALQQAHLIRLGLFLGLAVVLLALALLFRNNKRLQVKNTEIEHQRVQIEIAREQLAESNKTLEIRVAERTAELVKANQELIRTNDRIKEAHFKGQTVERKRVALELHDNLSSLLGAVSMSIQAINPLNLQASEQSVYQNVKQLIQNAYAEVRNISHNILPAELERNGLAVTLETHIGRLNQSSVIRFILTITDLNERLPASIEFNVYSIVLELLNNSIRHANPTTVTIHLHRTAFGIDLFATDDGIGFGQNLGRQGVGLQNIQARLDSLGGTFQALSPEERGTRIRIRIPIET